MSTSIAAAGLAFLATLLLAPLVSICVTRLGIVDRPDKHRKLHQREIPLCGGMSVLAGLALVIAGLLAFENSAGKILQQDLSVLTALALSAFVICAVGVIDDRIGLRGRHKLAGQILAATVLIALGFRVERVEFLSWEVSLGMLAGPLTLLWLLGTINALNLIDGMDGLATSVGIVLSLAICGISVLQGQAFDALLALMIAGSLLAFLYFNFAPARMFLGDAGSMLIGLLLGTLALRCSTFPSGGTMLTTAVALWAIPFFDVGIAIVRRKLTGRSIFMADRGHLHHCLLHRGHSCRSAMFAIAALCACTSCGAVAGIFLQHDTVSMLAVLGVTGYMVFTRFFGYAECELIRQRLRALACHWITPRTASAGRSSQLCAHLQGVQQWDELWQVLAGYAEQFDLVSVHLNLNVPAIHEEYHGSWSRKAKHDRSRLFDTEIPLLAGDRTIGRIRITTDSLARDAMCHWMSDLIASLKPFESRVLTLIAERQRLAELPAAPALRARFPGIWRLRPEKPYASASLAVPVIDGANR